MIPDKTIIKYVEEGIIGLEPFQKNNVGPCSVDLTLASEFRVFKPGIVVDPRNADSINSNTIFIDTKGKPFTLSPNQFILASTVEKLSISKKFVALLEGKSSIARLGVVVHSAGLVNPGTGEENPATLVLEIFCMNNSPVLLYPGMKIIQIMFDELESEASMGYDIRLSSKYVGQEGPAAPKFE
ncbi:dCTP deaminase [Elusimicrobiota bacterium]